MRATQRSQPYEYRECMGCGAVYPPSDDGELCDVCADELADREADTKIRAYRMSCGAEAY